MKGITRLNELMAKGEAGNQIKVAGWVRSIRKAKSFSFIMLNDGSSHQSVQIVADEKLSNYEIISTTPMGSSIIVNGLVVASQGKGQKFEIQAQSVELVGGVDDDYPLQKKATSLEFLREVAHLRCRTNTFNAVFRIRHGLGFAIHKYFHERGFYWAHSPIITATDAEGAGEMFSVTTLDLKKTPKDPKGEIDFDQDFFARKAHLTVSGQLEAETFALGLGKVYTFGPTFRAENSNTARHLSEFWMIEPEVAFCDIHGVCDLAEDFLKYLIQYALDNYRIELEFLQQHYQNGLVDVLTHVAKSSFKRLPYTEAVEILLKSGKTFEFPVKWGVDLQTEHERYLTEQHFKAPVMVTNYPKKIKAFYMKENEDKNTVAAVDVLVPGVGEIIGGSQREDNLEKLKARMKEVGIPEKEIWWYLDLRRFGSVPHGGFGLGFERLVMYVTGMSNIRDVIPYPRVPRNAEF